MPTLLVSTFTALLRVELSEDYAQHSCDVLHTGLGIYYGLAKDGQQVFAVARNLDVQRRTLQPGSGTNHVLCFDLSDLPETREPRSVLELGRDADLHQIAFPHGLLSLVSPVVPNLRAFTPDRGEWAGSRLG